MSASEVSRFRQQQALQEQAAHAGLYGPATIASHTFITARMEQAAPYLVQLLQAGKVEQCDQAVNEMTKELGRLEEVEDSVCHTMMTGGNNDA